MQLNVKIQKMDENIYCASVEYNSVAIVLGVYKTMEEAERAVDDVTANIRMIVTTDNVVPLR